MQKYSGFIIVFESYKQIGVFNTYFENDWLYSDILSDVDFSIKSSEIALISLDKSTISYLCLLRKRNKRVATRKCRVDFTNIIRIASPLHIEKITQDLPRKNALHFQNSTTGGIKRIPVGTWKALMDFLQREHLTVFDNIDKLNRLRLFKSDQYGIKGRGAEILIQEKDAINLALRFSNFSIEPLRKWVPPNDISAPFLKGLAKVKLFEDTMIIHDSSVFADWSPQKHDQVGTVSFVNKDEVITVWNVNRTPIEKTLGVDLIYYHHKFNAYVLIQYKRMEKEHDGGISGSDKLPFGYHEWIYRPIEKSYLEEIKRMRDFEQISIREDNPSRLTDYRFNDEAFYFKLCPAESFDPSGTEMIQGMYFPLSYWERLLSSPVTAGSRGGKLISYRNAGRYFTNTLFIELVKCGWIGTRELTSSQITKLIQDILESGKSLVLAEVHKLDTNGQTFTGPEGYDVGRLFGSKKPS